MPDAEGAVERLYEDTDIRDELRDDEANLLLKWAEDRLYKLAEQSATDEEFDARATQFRALLKGMNRLVGNRATLDEAALNASLADLSSQAAAIAAPSGQASAQTAAPPIAADQLSALAGKLPSLDDAGAVNALTTLFTPGAAPAVPAAALAEPSVQPAVTAPAAPVASQTQPDPASGTTPTASQPAEPPQASAFDDESGLFHRLSIHFWPPRKKNPPQ